MLCSGYFQSLFLSHESLELFIAPQHKYKVPQMHFAYTYLDIFEVKKIHIFYNSTMQHTKPKPCTAAVRCPYIVETIALDRTEHLLVAQLQNTVEVCQISLCRFNSFLVP